MTHMPMNDGVGCILVRQVSWHLARGLTELVIIILIIYVTYDAIYIHFWFDPEQAVVVPIVQSTIAVGGIFCHELLKRTQKRQLQTRAT